MIIAKLGLGQEGDGMARQLAGCCSVRFLEASEQIRGNPSEKSCVI